MPEEKRIIITLPVDLLQKIDKYAEAEHRGNRTQAVYHILKNFIETLDVMSDKTLIEGIRRTRKEGGKSKPYEPLSKEKPTRVKEKE